MKLNTKETIAVSAVAGVCGDAMQKRELQSMVVRSHRGGVTEVVGTDSVVAMILRIQGVTADRPVAVNGQEFERMTQQAHVARGCEGSVISADGVEIADKVGVVHPVHDVKSEFDAKLANDVCDLMEVTRTRKDNSVVLSIHYLKHIVDQFAKAAYPEETVKLHVDGPWMPVRLCTKSQVDGKPTVEALIMPRQK